MVIIHRCCDSILARNGLPRQLIASNKKSAFPLSQLELRKTGLLVVETNRKVTYLFTAWCTIVSYTE